MSNRAVYAAAVILLLGGLFLRAHRITELALFIDEDNHMVRAAAVHHLESHPAALSHGKFFLYLLLAIPDLGERDTALYLARTMVALASLLTPALIFALLRHFTRQAWIALAGCALYCLLPYAVFYERMALADPWAGTWGLVTLYAALKLAARPRYHWAMAAGAAAAATVAAKLTLAFAVGFLPLALLFFGRGIKPRYGIQLLLVAGMTFTVLWLPVLIPARISIVDEAAPDFMLMNIELVDPNRNADSLFTKVEQVWTKLVTLASLPAALVLVGLVLWAVWRFPRPTVFILACLALAWLPSVVIVENLQTRYLMSGLPLLVIAAGLGLQSISGVRRGVVVGAMMLWGLIFALPFAQTLMTHPPDAHLPPLDEQNYFWDRYNTYGEREAFAYLGARGGGRVMVLTKMCLQMDVYAGDNITPLCIEGFIRQNLHEIPWQAPVVEALSTGEPLYILTNEQPDVPPLDSEIRWQEIAVFPKPQGLQTVRLWQVSLD